MITAVELPSAIQQQLREEALRAFPRECCGLIEGKTLTLSAIPAKAGKGEGARVEALHPMLNIATQPDRFEVDPAQHIALLRKLRGTEHAIIGCYHSHPNGRAEPSEHDRESAVEPDFLWLIIAVNSDPVELIELAAFVSGAQSFSPVEIRNDPGTAGLRPAAGGKPSLPGFA
jgi:desampylase